MGHILVVAPYPDLLHSLQFALEADGHHVTAYALLGDVTELPGSFDCIIIDHHAIDRQTASVETIYASVAPVVLLANGASHPLAARSFRTVLKPLLGPFLSQAVAQAIAAAKRGP